MLSESGDVKIYVGFVSELMLNIASFSRRGKA